MSTLCVNFDQKTGKRVMPLHGFNGGPMTKVFTYDARPFFVEGGFPFARLHDVEYPYGSGEFVDIPCIFKNFDADENDPASYSFGNTDEYIRQCLLTDTKVIYRLGISIEHSPVKRYVDPPKDFAKWARICEHVIRHYNEGWGNGYRWGITYWEIWNEADLDRHRRQNPKCWSGTAEQFGELYAVTACHLKQCFPHLKIGGCGFSAPVNSFVEAFFAYVSQYPTPVPMDFYSWHCYTANPLMYVEKARQARSLLQRYGYGEAESLLDEWNLMYAWDFEHQSESYRAMKDHRGASFYAATLCTLQERTDVAIATNFEADVVKEFCGIFNVKNMCIGGFSADGQRKYAELEATKGFYAFRQFDRLYRLGEQVALTCEDPTVFATAAVGSDGYGVLIANPTGEERTLQLSLLGMEGDAELRVTDGGHTDHHLATLTAAQCGNLAVQLSPYSFFYLGSGLPASAARHKEAGIGE